jgi:ferredoxin
MRVRVDGERCQGHTICNMVAPELFALREDDGHSVALVDGDLDEEQQALALKAEMGCPERAIIVER